MLFERLADAVIKNRRLVVIGWTIALIISVPLATQVDSVSSTRGCIPGTRKASTTG